MTNTSPLTHLDYISSLLYHPACLRGVLATPRDWPFDTFSECGTPFIWNAMAYQDGKLLLLPQVSCYTLLCLRRSQKVLCTKYKALLHCSFSGWQTLAGIFSVFPMGDHILFISVSGIKQQLRTCLSECHVLPLSLWTRSFDLSTCSISPLNNGYLKFSLILSFFILSVRETGSHRETSAVPLQGILGAVMVMLLILGGGLYLWKTCGKKKNSETGMQRQVALLALVPDTCLFPLDPGFLSLAFCCTGNPSAESGWYSPGFRGHSNGRGLRIHSVYHSGAGLWEDNRHHAGGICCLEQSQQDSWEGRGKVAA